MRIFDQTIYEAVVKRNASHPANAYTETLMMDGKSYSYMSEVDPHRDESEEDHESKWTISFLAVLEDYYFVYHVDGVKHCIIPELNTPYSFHFRELHAFLHKDNLKFFEDEDHWNDFEPDCGLACIFVITCKE